MIEKLTQLLNVISPDWIEENPALTYDLIEGLVSDLRHYKDVVEMQNESMLLAKALIESMKK